MAQYYNPGRVNVEAMEHAILNAGGGKSVKISGGVKHVSVYLSSQSWHLSYDIQPDGSITNVHSTKDNRPFYDYDGGY